MADDAPREEKKEQRHLVTFDLSEEAFRRFEEIKALAAVTSNAQLLIHSLQAYEWLLETRNEGYEIIIRKDGIEKKIVEVALDGELLLSTDPKPAS